MTKTRTLGQPFSSFLTDMITEIPLKEVTKDLIEQKMCGMLIKV